MVPFSFLWSFISGSAQQNPTNARSDTERTTQQPIPTTSTSDSTSGNTASDIRLNRNRLLQNFASNNDEKYKKNIIFISLNILNLFFFWLLKLA